MSEDPQERYEGLSREQLIERIEDLEAENAGLREENKGLSRDSLTGWFRREPAKQEWLRLVKSDPNILRSPITVMSMDIKNLKQVNDLYSHEAGDKLIGDFSTHVNSTLGSIMGIKPWIPARLYEKGDEFGIILPGIGRRQQQDIEMKLLKYPVLAQIMEGTTVEVEFRTGFASSDGDVEKQTLKVLREDFPDDVEFAAELLNYLTKVADVKERDKKKNG